MYTHTQTHTHTHTQTHMLPHSQTHTRVEKWPFSFAPPEPRAAAVVNLRGV